MVAANLAKVAYFAERRRRKALGLPVRPHGGLRIKGEPYLITKARVMVKAELNTLMAGKVFREGDPVRSTDSERFNRLRTKALRTVEEILDLPNTLDHFDQNQAEHHKRLRMQLEAAQGIIANAVKIDESSLRHQEESDKIELWREELKNIKLPSKSG